MKNSLSILFYLRKSKVAENEEAPIYMRITVNGRRVDLATHQFIESERWDSQHGCIKGTKEDARTINISLDNKRSQVLKIFTQLETIGKTITAEIIRNHFLGKMINPAAIVYVCKLQRIEKIYIIRTYTAPTISTVDSFNTTGGPLQSCIAIIIIKKT